MILSKISLSDSNFSKKILRKYQKGKWNILNFPFMVFGNNLKHIFPGKFNINLLMQLNFHIYRPNILRIINDTKSSITFQQETISGFPASMYKFVPGQSKSNIIFPNILFYKSCMEASNAIFSESAFNYSLSNQIVRHFLLNYRDYGKKENITSDYTTFPKSINYGHTSIGQMNNLSLNKILQNTALYPRNITLSSDALFNKIRIYGNNSQTRKIGHKTILLDFRMTGKYYSSKNKNFGSNNLFGYDSAKYSITFIQPVHKKDGIKNSSNSFSSISMQKRDVQINDNFYFQNHTQMDQKMEQIKKISQEAKEIVAQKSLSGSSAKSEMQPEIDINRLSNKVYKMIEYNMKIEKERRGYL